MQSYQVSNQDIKESKNTNWVSVKVNTILDSLKEELQ